MTSHSPTPSAAAIAGHPLHPIVVPVPIAATVLALGCDVAARGTGDARLAWGSRWLLRVALVGGALAAPLGTVDALRIRSGQTSRLAWAHGIINASVLALVGSESLVRGTSRVRANETRPWLTGLAVGLLGVSGWLGGELAYRRGVGVDLRVRRTPHGPAASTVRLAAANSSASRAPAIASPGEIRDEALEIVGRTWPDGSPPDEVAEAMGRIEQAAAGATTDPGLRGRLLADLGTIREAAALISS